MTTLSPTAPDVARVLGYVRSDAGRRNRRALMQGRGYSYERTIGEQVVYVLQNCRNGRLRDVDYEYVAELTDRVIIAETSGSREPGEVA
ncbi:MAG: hypothetical protein WC815_23820 [Vicinamibacterales bacterium]|jgi:hypothetical protein